MLNWADRFSIFCFLDSHHYSQEKQGFSFLMAAGCNKKIELPVRDGFKFLQQNYNENSAWWFGHLGFDFQDHILKTETPRNSTISFGPGFFFEPEYLVSYSQDRLLIQSIARDPVNVFDEISQFLPSSLPGIAATPVFPMPKISKKKYLADVTSLQQHIRRGDCYEINYCQEFVSADATINPLHTFFSLGQLSPNPFAALYKLEDKYCICESPERYVKLEGEHVSSAPIKGTAPRYPENDDLDAISKKALAESTKDRSENVMIVDLVRNDLSKVCKEGSVKVDELFGVYSFPGIHHLVSSISGTIKKNISWIDVLEATFPMGSMTGAPKKKVLELIRQYERSSRGLFSGTIGYVKPGGDMDFNVVIRSVMYDNKEKLLSFWAGGGITFYSDPEKEYEECLLKAAAIIAVLNN